MGKGFKSKEWEYIQNLFAQIQESVQRTAY